MAFADTAKLAVNLSLEGNFQSGINKAESSLSSFNNAVGKTAAKVGNDLGRGIRTSAQNLERLAFVAGGLAIGAGAAVTKWAGDFQAQLNTINTIAFATPQALDQIGNGIRDIAKKTGLSLDDLTASYYDLLSAGVKTADAQSLLNNAVTLGIGGLATTQQTVDLLTTAYNAYHLTAAQATVATDQFAQAVADGKVKADQIAASFADVASIANTYKVGIDQIATSYAFLTAQGVPATEVTTEMNRAIISLIKPLPALADAQKALKINFTEEIQKKGLVPALQELRLYADKNKIPLIELLGRVEAVKFALQTTGPNFQGFLTEQQRILASGGEAAKQAAERQQGFNFQLARLKANLKDAGITIGTYLLPPLADLSGELSDFLAGHQDEIKQFGQNLGNGVRDAVKWFKSLDWNAIAAGIRTAAGFVQSLVQGFAALPTETKGLLLGLYGLNKLSGGAVVNIGVDLFKGVGGGLQQFLGRGSPANPMFVVPVGGGLGGVGGIGGASILTMALSAVTIDALVIGLGQAVANAIGATPQNPVDSASRSFYRHGGGATNATPIGPNPDRGDGRPAVNNAFSLEARDAAFKANALDVFGAHNINFALKQFRSSAQGAIDLFGSRIQYLAGAQGSGAGSQQYLGVVARDIGALKSLLPTASDRQKVAITGEIKILEGILRDKKFVADTPKINVIPTTLKGKAADDVALTASLARKTQDDTRENGRILRQTGQVTASKIDYAKVATVNATDAAAAAIDRSRDAIVRAILGLGHIGVTVSTSTIQKKSTTVNAWTNPTTSNRGGAVAS